MKELPYAEDVNYWETSQTSPDSWIDKTERLIISKGGRVIKEAYGNEPTLNRAAYMLIFEIEGDLFKIIWPVLPSKTHKDRSARIQAATMLYHDIKAKCLSAEVLGSRTAFFSYFLLPDGRSVTEASIPELSQGIPALFNPRLNSGEIVDGEIS